VPYLTMFVLSLGILWRATLTGKYNVTQ